MIKFFPKKLRDKGIGNKTDLILTIVPYMEWIDSKELRKKYFKVLPTDRRDSLSPRVCQQVNLKKLERKNVGDKVYYRRIIKKNTNPRRKFWIDGTLGFKSAIEQGKKGMKVKKVKNISIFNMTYADYEYIKNNPHNMSDNKLSLMYNVSWNTIKAIRGGKYMPVHLREQLAQ